MSNKAEQERINLKAAKERLDHFYCGEAPPASDYYASMLYYGSPVEVYGYDDPIVRPTNQPFNPYDVGVVSFLTNSWLTRLERAKQENTPPKIYTYEKPAPTGGKTGGGILGWFSGIPGWFTNLPERSRDLRAQNQKEWEEWKAASEERKRISTNINSQEVISDNDLNDPSINIEGGLDIPSAAPSGNTWDDFARGVKEGWDAGGLTDYKTPLMIAGGVLVLILIIK